MKFTKWKLIPVLVFILSTASIFRFFKITTITTTSQLLPYVVLPPIQHRFSHSSTNKSNLTEKEKRLLLEFFSRRVPCNLLIFGHAQQYSHIAKMNTGGFTIFLEENQNPRTRRSSSTNNTKVYRIKYNTVASDAYRLLKKARENPDCTPGIFYLPKMLRCQLAMLNIPDEVYDTKWDVVMVDGPSGDRPDSAGRMAAIYTASILARRGGNSSMSSSVLVHDVNRIIEKWFSWEFLCEENLVSSKGRFWHFQIPRVFNITRFCTT